MTRFALVGIFLLLAQVPTPLSLAFEQDDQFGYISSFGGTSGADDSMSEPDSSFSAEADDGQRVRKFELALKALGISPEPAPKFLVTPRASEVSQKAFLQTLSSLNPDSALKRYLHLDKSSIDLYRDFYSPILSNEFRETHIDATSVGPSRDSSALLARLQAIAQQAKTPGNPKPLKGLRVAIDPGHMGTTDWDNITGKYVQLTNKKTKFSTRVSEGQLTLWTALLTAAALKEQGATVMITRKNLEPVSRKNFRTYDHTPYLNQYFYDSLDGWMAKYLRLSERELTAKIKTFPESKYVVSGAIQAFPTSAAGLQALKTHLFVTSEDLEARTQMISDFHPDLTLDIHFDAEGLHSTQTSSNNVAAYVPGYFGERDLGSRAVRALVFQQALESRRWNQSVNIATHVTRRISEATGVPLMNVPALVLQRSPVAVKVKNGVYTRNLYITRHNLEGLMVYLECLHYDFESEFKLLSQKDKTSHYQDVTFEHPARLQKVADGIQRGILDYFRSL